MLDDKVAHGHYDGYCKQSEFLIVTTVVLLSFAFSCDSFFQHFGRSSTTFSGRTSRLRPYPHPFRRMNTGPRMSKLIPHLRVEYWTYIVRETSFGCMTTTSFSYPSCSVCWFPTSTSASLCIPHGQAAKSSVVFPVRMQAFCNEVALTSSSLRAKGNLGWHAWCQPCMFPDLFVFSPLYVILRTCMWI